MLPVTSGRRSASVDYSGKPTTIKPPHSTDRGRSSEDEDGVDDVHDADAATVVLPVTSGRRPASVDCNGEPLTVGPPLTTDRGRSSEA